MTNDHLSSLAATSSRDVVGLRLGRILFAVAMLGFGVLSLAFGRSVHQLQPLVEFLPDTSTLSRVVSFATGVFLVGAGLAILTKWRVRAFAAAVAAFFGFWILVLHIPSVFLAPELLRSAFWVRTFETLSLGGGALTVAGLTGASTQERWIRLGRIVLGVSLPVFGILHLIYAENVAALIPSWYPWPLFLAYLTGSAKIVAGISLLTGKLSRLAATLVGVLFGTYVVTLHIPRVVTIHWPQLWSGDAAALQAARGGLTSLCVAIGMSGTALLIAASVGRSHAADVSWPEASHSLRVSEPAA